MRLLQCFFLYAVPYHVHEDLYGPMPQPGKIGEIDSRGAYGYDTFCGCMKQFGVRPEMMTTVALTQNLSFEDSQYLRSFYRFCAHLVAPCQLHYGRLRSSAPDSCDS